MNNKIASSIQIRELVQSIIELSMNRNQ